MASVYSGESFIVEVGHFWSEYAIKPHLLREVVGSGLDFCILNCTNCAALTKLTSATKMAHNKTDCWRTSLVVPKACPSFHFEPFQFHKWFQFATCPSTTDCTRFPHGESLSQPFARSLALSHVLFRPTDSLDWDSVIDRRILGFGY